MQQHRFLLLSVSVLVFMVSACSPAKPLTMPAVPVDPTASIEPTLAATPNPSPTPAPTLTPTPLPPPTVLLEPRLYNIDIAQLKEVPQDLYEQVYQYSGGAGGGDFGDTETEKPAMLVWAKSYASAVEPATPSRLAWEVEIDPNTPIPEGWLMLPDGSKVQLEIKDVNDGLDGFIEFSYQIIPGAPLGTYTLEIKQGDFTLQDSVTLAQPSKPIWVNYQGNSWYAGFIPDEQITLHLCDSVSIDAWNAASLSEYTDFNKYIPESSGFSMFYNGSVCRKKYVVPITADEYGTFQVHVPEGYRIGVIAELSGVDTTVNKCGNSLPPRLKINKMAQVSNFKETSGTLVEDFSIITLPMGAQVKPVFGPVCNLGEEEAYWQWIVETSDHIFVWVFESSTKGYFLESVNP